MVVTARAAHRQSQPYGRGRFDPVDHVLDRVFRVDNAAFSVTPVVAIETTGDLLFERGVGQHVASDLLDRELIERHIVVERLDHPVTPSPHVALRVGLVTVGVGVAGGIQPADGHALAVPRRFQQPVNYLFVGAW